MVRFAALVPVPLRDGPNRVGAIPIAIAIAIPIAIRLGGVVAAGNLSVFGLPAAIFLPPDISASFARVKRSMTRIGQAMVKAEISGGRNMGSGM
jgi:hypothetical protein